MLEFAIHGIGVVAPGLKGWQQARIVLSGAAPYVAEPLPRLTPGILPANERRRVSSLSKLAIESASQAVSHANRPSDFLMTFATASGELDIAQKICHSLWLPGHPVSPTAFHNTVHNAATGYWSIATGSHASSTTLTAFNATFAAGLLDAVVTANAEQRDVLYCIFDMGCDPPLGNAVPFIDSFSCAFMVGPAVQSSDACNCRVDLNAIGKESRCQQPALEKLRTNTPAGRALPMLSQLAGDKAATTHFPYLYGQSMMVELTGDA